MENDKKNLKYYMWILVFAAFLFFTLLFFLYKKDGPDLPVLVGHKNLYTQSLLEQFPNLHLEDQSSDFDANPFYALTTDDYLECFDIHALPALKHNFASHWYPHCLATVVIAVDRSLTDQTVHGWNDLRDLGVSVDLSGSDTLKTLFLSSISYGLEGENFTEKSTFSLLNDLKKNNLLTEDNLLAPVRICFDYQAVEMIRKGKNLEIIIPEEGTLSFQLGILSNIEFPHVSLESLADNGLCLIDQTSRDPAYKAIKQYGQATHLKDYSHLLKQSEDLITKFKREILKERLYSSANRKEHVIFLLTAIIITLIWMKAAIHRSIHSNIKKAFYLVTFCSTGWLLLRLFKYQLSDYSIFSIISRYAFYIFLMGLPLIILYISIIIDHPESKPRLPKWFYCLGSLYPIFLLLVFTNKHHQLVYVFEEIGVYRNIYDYGFIYFFIFIYCGFLLFLSILILFKKGRKKPKQSGNFFLICIEIFIFVYGTAYASGVPIARNSDLTLITCTFSLVFCESAIHTGLIPTNTHYKQLFTCSPLNMQLLDLQGDTIFASTNATILNTQQREKLQSASSVCIPLNKNILLFGQSIQGGTVVWQENISELNHFQRQVKNSVKKLHAANLLLYKEKEIRQKKISTEIKTQIFNNLEEEIQDKTKELFRALKHLPDVKDKQPYTSYIALLLCHIKRRCNLFFIALENDHILANDFSLYLNELSEFAGYADVKALVHTDFIDKLDLKIATLFYDFYFTVLAWSILNYNPTLLGQVSYKNNAMKFHIMSFLDLKHIPFSISFLQEIEQENGKIKIENLDETVGISLIFTKEGEMKHE